MSGTTDSHNSGTGLVQILEEPEPPGRTLGSALDAKLLAKVTGRIDDLLADPNGLPDGRKRTKLSEENAEKFKLALIIAVGHASVWASSGPLPNRVRGPGRPPDNAFFVFIDDLADALEVVGLKPGLRYMDPVSLLVSLFTELAPLLWGPVKAPRRLFERWQRYRADLHRG